MSDSLPPVDCSLPGSSVHGIFQAGVLEWGATAFSIIPSGSAVKNLPAMWEPPGDTGSIPGSERLSGEGRDNPLQYSCLENPRVEEPGGLQSMGFQTIGYYKATHTCKGGYMPYIGQNL